MLVLARKPQQAIVIEGPPRITIVVTRIERGKVHIGIDAPQDVVIVRGELLERNQQEKEHDG